MSAGSILGNIWRGTQNFFAAGGLPTGAGGASSPIGQQINSGASIEAKKLESNPLGVGSIPTLGGMIGPGSMMGATSGADNSLFNSVGLSSVMGGGSGGSGGTGTAFYMQGFPQLLLGLAGAIIAFIVISSALKTDAINVALKSAAA